MSQLIQVLHTQIGAPVIVHGHIADGNLPQVFTHEYRGNPGQVLGKGIVALRAAGKQNDAVHLTGDHQLKQLLFQLQIPGGIA